MGEVAARYCNEVILTNEDPYDEDPMKILEQIAEGFPKNEEGEFVVRRFDLDGILCMRSGAETQTEQYCGG